MAQPPIRFEFLNDENEIHYTAQFFIYISVIIYVEIHVQFNTKNSFLMKKFFTFSLILIGFYVGAAAQTAPTATATTTAPIAKTEKVKHSKKHSKTHTVKTAAALYECPMKCTKASTTAGKCEKCGMDKVALK